MQSKLNFHTWIALFNWAIYSLWDIVEIWSPKPVLHPHGWMWFDHKLKYPLSHALLKQQTELVLQWHLPVFRGGIKYGILRAPARACMFCCKKQMCFFFKSVLAAKIYQRPLEEKKRCIPSAMLFLWTYDREIIADSPRSTLLEEILFPACGDFRALVALPPSLCY